jgi:hypothetical protein
MGTRTTRKTKTIADIYKPQRPEVTCCRWSLRSAGIRNHCEKKRGACPYSGLIVTVAGVFGPIVGWFA